jgi:DNA-binding NarL/FixJ family response regulator
MTNPSPNSRIRVVIADDHPIVRSGIAGQLSLEPDIEVQGQAVDGGEALRLVHNLLPDVLILDINMPGIRSVDVIQQLQTMPRPPHVLILTAHNDIESVLILLKAGAKGYVLKDEEPQAITTAVRAVAQGRTWLSAAVMTSMVDHTTRDALKTDTRELSSREVEVLRLLAEGRENQDIGDILGISERTVRYHLRNIYDKLDVQTRGAAIAWAVRQRLNEV